MTTARVITRIVKIGGRANDLRIAQDIDRQADTAILQGYGPNTYTANLRHDARAWRTRQTPTLVILSRRKTRKG